MTSWKSYTHKYVQFKAKCQDIYMPQFMITASDQTFSDQLYHLTEFFMAC